MSQPRIEETSMRKRLTARERILSMPLQLFPITATDLADGLGMRTDSISSLLRRMVKEGTMKVIPNFGPRGGNGYVPETEYKAVRRGIDIA